MLVNLCDFDVDMFLTFEDDNIFIYYSDFETIPDLVDLVPLGSFDDLTESYLWVNLDYNVRLEVGLLFMERDLYSYEDPNTKEIMIDREMFMNEFKNVPEVTTFFDQYKNICENYGTIQYPIPKSWIGWDKPIQEGWIDEDLVNNEKYINWNNYPNWCQECTEYTYSNPASKCAYKIPIGVMPPSDIYFICVVYFNGIYRTNPESIQDFGLYEILTDVNFELNVYSMIIDIKKFFTLEFQWFLKTVPGNIPFACDYGTHIKHAVQTKNDEVRRIRVQNEINFFIYNFNKIYDNWVTVQNIRVDTSESKTGGDTWLIEVEAVIKKEKLIYRIESET